jgi:hypothetical protein
MRNIQSTPIGFHLDSTFDMDFFTSGHDEEGQPVLEVNLHALIVAGPQDDDGSIPASMDTKHRMAHETIPWDSLGMSDEEIETAKALEGWYTVSADGRGETAHTLEATFGPRVALIILKALMSALANELAGVDIEGQPYRLSRGVSGEGVGWTTIVMGELLGRLAAPGQG